MTERVTERLVAGRYRLGKSIGSGGMGRVWLARDEVLRRSVAVKEVLLPESLDNDEAVELRMRTLREARAAARLAHPNVVRIYDVIYADGRPWIVMEYVPSRSLAQVISENGPISPAAAAKVGLAVLGALVAAHEAGVLHRDVKPGNVLLAEDGRVVLTDFGLAVFDDLGVALTQSGIIHGSPQFIAPERALDGTSSQESDMWSLGATLYAAVEGRSPYSRPSSYATLAALATAPPDPPHRAGALKPVLAGLLRRNPRSRMKPDEVRTRLQKIAAPDSGRRLVPRPRKQGDAEYTDTPSPRGLNGSRRPSPSPRPTPVTTVTSDAPPLTDPPARGVAQPDALSKSPVLTPVVTPRTAPSPGGTPAVNPPSATPPGVDQGLPPLPVRNPGTYAGTRPPPSTLPTRTQGDSGIGSGAPDMTPEHHIGIAALLAGLDRDGSDRDGPVTPIMSYPPDVPRGDRGWTRRRPSVRWMLIALVAIAVVGTSIIAFQRASKDHKTGHAPLAGPSTVSPLALALPCPNSPPVTPSAAPPGPTVLNNRSVADDWSWYIAPSGIRIGMPNGWNALNSPGVTCFYAPSGGSVLSVADWSTVTNDPVVALTGKANAMLAAGAPPGYALTRPITTAGYQPNVGVWEYTYVNPQGIKMHVQVWADFSTPGHAYAFSWETTEFDWIPDSSSYLSLLIATFAPPP